MRIDMTVGGVNKTVLKFKLLDTRVREDIKKGMYQATRLVVDRAKQNLNGDFAPTPNRHWITGNLSRGTQSKVGWVNTYDIEGVIGTDVPYAPKIEALPDGGYLYPALKANDKKIRAEIQKSIKEAINRTR